MPAKLFVRFPQEGCDCVLAIQNPHNISGEIAAGIYRLYCRYNDEGGLIVSEPFAPNECYQLIHTRRDDVLGQGLVFRLYASGLAGDEPAIEFYVPDEYRLQRDVLLLELPTLLQTVGVRDLDLLLTLADKLAEHCLAVNQVMAWTVIYLLRQLAEGSFRYRAVLENHIIPAVAALPPTHSVPQAFFRDKVAPEFEGFAPGLGAKQDWLANIIGANEEIANDNQSQGLRESPLTGQVRRCFGYSVGRTIPLDEWFARPQFNPPRDL